jgi:four helix bundle protein
MEPIHKFEDLIAWQKAHALVLAIYKLTTNFPKEELFGLTSQIRRSAASAPANIAEGFSRTSNTEKIRFYNISEASIEETRYHLILANDLNYANTLELQNLAHEIKKIIGGLIKSIKLSH